MHLASLLLLLLGESQEVETSVTRAIRYLARHQAEDGSWGRFDLTCGCRSDLPIETELPIPIDAALEPGFNRLLEEMAADAAPTREAAQRKVRHLGSRSVPLLQKSLRHRDPEVALRCRETLTSMWKNEPELRSLRHGIGREEEADFQVLATGLGVLCFVGAGYSPLSKDEWEDPPGRRYQAGAVVKNAAKWLLSRQWEDGSFAVRDPLAHAVATAALSELYGFTASSVLRDPLEEALTSLNTLQGAEPSFQLWKGLALHSAHLSELPWFDHEPCARSAEDLGKPGSPLALGSALLFKSCRKQPIKPLGDRIVALGPTELSPIDTWVIRIAVLELKNDAPKKSWIDARWNEMAQAQARGAGCESGSWSGSGERWNDSLIRTMYATLTVERTYRYNCALFQLGAGR